MFFYRRAEPPLEDAVSNYCGFLHPLLAVLLSLFDGAKRLNDVVREYTLLTGIEQQAVSAIVTSLVENKKEVALEFDRTTFYFPKNTLIKKERGKGFRRYNPAGFLIPAESLDFDTKRLYVPIDLTLILTNRCATRCIYCYVDKHEALSCKIPFERITELIREAKELGMRSFMPSGGDLFTYRYWRALLRELVANGFDPFVSTKFPLTRRQVEELKDIGIKEIQLSIDTVRKDEMVKMLGVNENYYDKILKTLEELDRHNFTIRVNSQVTSVNEGSAEELLDYMLRFENVRLVRFCATGYSLYKDAENYLAVRPGKTELAKIRALVEEREKLLRDRKIKLDFYEYPEEKYYAGSRQFKTDSYENRAQCSGNFRAFHILPDGKATICEELYWHPRFIIGDIMTQSIEEIWNSEEALSLYRLSQEEVGEGSACRTCGKFDECHRQKGVCWKQVLYAYGEEKWDYPDPRCPEAPKPERTFWID